MAMIEGDWQEALSPEFKKPYYAQLYRFIRDAYAKSVVYPPSEDIFNAFHYTPLKDVRVLIIGQDPYHEPGQAHGLCFSVLPEQKKLPPSLKNIYKELQDDLGCRIPNNGYLKKWATQGVLLLNTLLTVEAHRPMSHQGKGWETFTDAVIDVVNAQERPIVCMLWGKAAQEKAAKINNPNFLILKAAHPSPYSAANGFFGCRHFSKCNAFLREHGETEIDWQIDDI